LADFLALLAGDFSEARHVVEFRHKSWYDDEVYALLEERRAALCLADMPRAAVSGVATAPFVYVRRHGPQGRYRAEYPPEHLDADAAQIAQWLDEGRDVFVYFNNDIEGYAVKNARELRERVAGRMG
jgi:uncharacterized protein YecE (DUF72 family)